jgi:hypothetical protein
VVREENACHGFEDAEVLAPAHRREDDAAIRVRAGCQQYWLDGDDD